MQKNWSQNPEIPQEKHHAIWRDNKNEKCYTQKGENGIKLMIFSHFLLATWIEWAERRIYLDESPLAI